LTRLRGRSRFGEAKARASIERKAFFEEMDARVKPGHDDSESRRATHDT
jgi:hypothetical protein